MPMPLWLQEDLAKQDARDARADAAPVPPFAAALNASLGRFTARLIESDAARAERFAIYGAADYRNGKPRPACPLHAAGWDRARRDEAQRLLDAEYEAWVAAGCPDEGVTA